MLKEVPKKIEKDHKQKWYFYKTNSLKSIGKSTLSRNGTFLKQTVYIN